MGKELMSVSKLELTELKIPSTKLSFMQEKKYKEYAVKVLNDIGEKMAKIQTQEQVDFLEENREKIIKSIASSNPIVGTTLKAANSKLLEIRKHLKERDNWRADVQNEIDVLQDKKQNITQKFDSKIKKSILELEKVRNELEKKETVIAPNTLKAEYSDDRSGERPMHVDIPDWDLTAEYIIKDSLITDQLNEHYEKAAKETTRTRETIKELKEKVDEVMLFDETKLKPLFEQILRLKNMVKGKYATMFL